MDKRPIAVKELVLQPFTAFDPEGVLLVSGQGPEHANPMTISWGTFGIMWNKPVAMVMVRFSRHTLGFISGSEDFTVNWMPEDWREAVRLCGKVSGRDTDKFAATGMHPVNGVLANSPVVQESILSLECRTLYRFNMDPDARDQWLDAEIMQKYYGSGDYHRLFVGEIIAATGIDSFRK